MEVEAVVEGSPHRSNLDNQLAEVVDSLVEDMKVDALNCTKNRQKNCLFTRSMLIVSKPIIVLKRKSKGM